MTKAYDDDLERRLAAASGTKTEKKKRIMLYVDPGLHGRLKAFCEDRRMSMNHGCTVAIETMLDYAEDEE